MTNETKPTSSAATAGWIRIIAVLAATAILIGMIMGEGGDVEVFGFTIRATWVGLVLYFLGFFAGMYSRRDR